MNEFQAIDAFWQWFEAHRREGRLFELRPEPLDEAQRSLERVSRQWDDALARLKSFVEPSQGLSKSPCAITRHRGTGF
jgi:hypothetical protein